MKYMIITSGSYDDYSMHSLVKAPDEMDAKKLSNYYKEGHEDYFEEYVVKVENEHKTHPLTDPKGDYYLKTGEVVHYRYQVFVHYHKWFLNKFNLEEVPYEELYIGDSL